MFSWWKICSSNSKTTAALLPDMRRKLSISVLLSVLPDNFESNQTGISEKHLSILAAGTAF